MSGQQPYVTIRARRPADGNINGIGIGNGSSAAMGPNDMHARSATHDISRASFHVKHIGQFAQRLEDSAARAFPNRGRSSQRYKNVQALLLHWGSDDLFVLPELEDLEKCLREDYAFGTDIFAIPSENSHLELMMRVGQLIKDHESQDTLFVVYYGGHARIDESRQSTWCATRDSDSPWLQWSAIQTLLERSKSDVLILLDCCAGAASATFPNGNSITETISASSWDAIAPDPGRYSFTNALIEVLQEWRLRVFSAAMIHAEVLARLKHPRPMTMNGKHFEARSTPVHFMMTSNHKAPSIEISRALPVEKRPLSAPTNSNLNLEPNVGRAASPADALLGGPVLNEPTEDTPHVMISLALEEDQRLDINAWEQWLNAFPSMAKYVKIQGVFKSHSTLMLVSMPVMIWDLLPEDPATSFVAFIRSNNMVAQKQQVPPISVAVPIQHPQPETTGPDSASFVSGVSGTTFAPTESSRFAEGSLGFTATTRDAAGNTRTMRDMIHPSQPATPGHLQHPQSSSPSRSHTSLMRPINSASSLNALKQQYSNTPSTNMNPFISQHMILNQQQSQRRTTFGDNVPEPKSFAAHVEKRLEDYHHHQPLPNDAESALLASNLGIEPLHLGLWFHHRRQRDLVTSRLAAMQVNDLAYDEGSGPLMILPADLSQLLEIFLPEQILLFDVRSQPEYQKSHIRGGINLRMPQSFIRGASLEMIGRAIAEEQGRGAFKWQDAKCIVFYSRALEHSWECPSSESMLNKLLESGWTGRSFILKGHYREFSASFDRYIVDEKKGLQVDNVSSERRDQQQHEAESYTGATEAEERYAKWLSHVEAEARARTNVSSLTRTSEQIEAMENHEQELESELKARSGDLYRKAQDIQSGSDLADRDPSNIKAQMVEYLDRGITKMLGRQSPSPPVAYSSKLADEGYVDRGHQDQDETDEYVEISKGGDSTGVVRSGLKASGDKGGPSEDTTRKGRGGGLLNKVFRRA